MDTRAYVKQFARGLGCWEEPVYGPVSAAPILGNFKAALFFMAQITIYLGAATGPFIGFTIPQIGARTCDDCFGTAP